MLKIIKKRLDFLKNPGAYPLNEVTLETAVADHMKLLLLLGAIATIAHFSWFVGRAAFLNLINNVDINWINLFNYALGAGGGIGLFYLAAGTFFVLGISLPLWIILRIKYVKMLTVLLYALTPIMFFAWFPMFILPLAIWSVFLFVVGLKKIRRKG